MDTSELEAAYRSVLDLAARGAEDGPGTGPGSPGAGAGTGVAGDGDGENDVTYLI